MLPTYCRVRQQFIGKSFPCDTRAPWHASIRRALYTISGLASKLLSRKREVFFMGSGYYVAAAALAAQTQSLDVVANNLANVATTGYRKQQAVFQSLLESGAGGPPQLAAAVNNFGVLGGSRVDLSSATLTETGNPLDAGFSGDGFFTVETQAGIVYTRNGNFHVTRDGYLATADGDYVIGDDGTAKGAKISIPSGIVSVSADGTISVNGAVAGKLRLAGFPAGTEFRAEGGSNLTTSATASAATGTVRQGTLENSNATPVDGMIELITAQRNAEMMTRAFSALDGQINQTAVQQLERIPT